MVAAVLDSKQLHFHNEQIARNLQTAWFRPSLHDKITQHSCHKPTSKQACLFMEIQQSPKINHTINIVFNKLKNELYNIYTFQTG
ncbi:hypothetical protein MPL1_02943 [Methylophaga lonarensis MPL]|uniref:Uncharacterized protein n=1 Tax=Methylophaga lonarensis MPL TaxID=1286106 RepID=M7P2Y5_9GAMM|nr:hypothetical protein MPL1_02943 [Methylophaga lonarensis MPL]